MTCQKKKKANKKLKRQSAATICTGTPSIVCCWVPMPVNPIAIRSLESWFRVALFLLLRSYSSPSCLSFIIVAFASKSCTRKSWLSFGGSSAALETGNPSIGWTVDVIEVAEPCAIRISLPFSGRGSAWETEMAGFSKWFVVAASGAGEPNEGAGEPYAGGASSVGCYDYINSVWLRGGYNEDHPHSSI